MAAIAGGCAALLVTGVLSPLSFGGSASADDDITGPLIAAINRTAGSVEESLAAAQAAAEALTTHLGDLQGQLEPLLAELADNPQGALDAIVALVTSEVGSLAGIGLTQALALVSKVTAPTCNILGTLTATLPDLSVLPLPYELLGPLGPTLEQLDIGVSDALLEYYTKAVTLLLTPVALPAGLEAIQPYLTLAQTLLGLLKINWHTTYYPPSGGDPVVRDAPAFLGLPMVLDVDRHVGYDVCGLMNVDLTTGGITESISRVPLLGPTKLPLDIKAQFLNGVIAPGYETKNSKAPAAFDTSATLTGSTLDTTLLKTGTTFDQTLNLTDALQYRWASTTPPGKYHFASTKPGGATGNGTQLNYTADVPSDSFAYSISAAGIKLGVAQTPGASGFEYCTSAKGFCSNEPPADSATEQGSMHFVANEPITVDQTNSLDTSACASVAVLGAAHLTGSRMYLGHDPTASASAPGHVWVDTDGLPVNGCLATASMVGTLPVGFQAENRRAAWLGTGTPPVTAKSGTVTCPSGTAMTRSIAIIGFGLSRYFCAFPPANIAIPTIGGQAFQASVLTAAKGTWTPAAPNLPTFTYQWQRCLGTSCVNIPNPSADPTKYTATAADLNSTLRVAVTGTNPDGFATAYSLPTATITPPPPPVNITPPAISGIAGTNKTLTGTDGTWQNSPTHFDRQWLRCAEDGSACTAIAGATNPTYLTTGDDLGRQIKLQVIATNVVGATATATSAGLLIPPPPVLVDLPVIKNGSLPATAQSVFEGDHLSVDNGNFTYGATYAQQWLRCDIGGANCIPIGAVGPTYIASHDDIGSTIAVTVTASNADGSLAADALPTGQVLANAPLGIAPNQVPDGSIAAAVPSDHDTNYVGGTFDTVGPQIGGAGSVPATPTAASKNAALAALVSGGNVNAVASDTTGGYFLGGTFTRVVGAACKAIAHVRADGTLDTAYCQTGLGGEIRALDYVKAANITIGGATNQAVDVLVAGGAFTLTDGHKNLVFLDNAGLPSYATQGDPDGAVNAITNDTSAKRPNFFLGGEFTNLVPTAGASTPVKRLAAIAISATPTAGNPIALAGQGYPGGVDCAGSTCTNPVVRALSFASTGNLTSYIMVGGVFDSAYGTGTNAGTRVARNNAAAFIEGTTNQLVGQWDPNPDGAVNAISSFVSAPNVSVYLAGNFSSLRSGTGSATVSGFKGVAEYGLTTGTMSVSPFLTPKANAAGTAATSSPNTAWQPAIDNGRVLSMVADSAGVYLGGSFTSVNGAVRHRLAQFPIPGAGAPTLAAWDPNAGQTVRSLAKFTPGSGTPAIFVGGDYLVLGGETRNNVAELSKTGVFTTWSPAGTNGPVRALAFVPGTLYAGGDFSKAGGANRANLAAFDTGSGAATAAWNPGVDGPVNALKVGGTTVYVGGAFASVNGAPRANLAAVDPSGTVTGWNPGTTGTSALVRAIAVGGSHVYVGGTFASAGGSSGANLADIDATSGNAGTWGPGTDGSVYALAVSALTVYVGGDFGSAGGQARTNAAAVNRSDGLATGWVAQADGIVRALLVLGSTVFAGGDFATIGGLARANAAQLSNDTGEATGFLPDPNGRVSALTVTPGGVLGIFGSFTSLAGGTRTSGYGFYGG